MGNSKCTCNLIDIVRLPLTEGCPNWISSSILHEKIILKSHYSVNLIIFDPYMNTHLAHLHFFKIAINLHFEGLVFYRCSFLVSFLYVLFALDSSVTAVTRLIYLFVVSISMKI